MKKSIFLIALIASAICASAQVSVEASIDSIEMFVGQQVHVTLTTHAKENAKIEFPVFKPTNISHQGWRFFPAKS